MDFLKIKIFCSLRDIKRMNQEKPQTGEEKNWEIINYDNQFGTVFSNSNCHNLLAAFNVSRTQVLYIRHLF